MRLIAYQVVFGVVSGMIRRVGDVVKKAWEEIGSNKEDELALSPVAIEE
jgi:hypothetical protein